MKLLLSFLILFALVVPSCGYAATITCACTLAGVSAAISSAADGDTVLCSPAGQSASWNGDVTIPNTKGITLDGNGATITGTVSGQINRGSINIQQNSTTPSRVTGFTFTNNQAIATNGVKSSAPFRIDHCTFTGGNIIVETMGNAPGLIDHNSFTADDEGTMIYNYGSFDETGWSDDITPGSADAVYIEDNTFSKRVLTGPPPIDYFQPAAIQSYGSARTVFRYNKCIMCYVSQYGARNVVGARWWEIYENTFYVVQGGAQKDYIVIRAGSGVIFNNHNTGFPNLGIGSIEFLDEDSGYPAGYQVGRGKNQVLDPAYVWSNDSSMRVGSSSSNVQVNRDFYLTPKPRYTPYTYPHPLALKQSANPGPRLSPPSNLRIIVQ